MLRHLTSAVIFFPFKYTFFKNFFYVNVMALWKGSQACHTNTKPVGLYVSENNSDTLQKKNNLKNSHSKRKIWLIIVVSHNQVYELKPDPLQA